MISVEHDPYLWHGAWCGDCQDYRRTPGLVGCTHVVGRPLYDEDWD